MFKQFLRIKKLAGRFIPTFWFLIALPHSCTKNNKYFYLQTKTYRFMGLRVLLILTCSKEKPYSSDMSVSLAAAVSLLLFISWMMLSMRPRARSMPSTTWSRARSLPSWLALRRRIVSNLRRDYNHNHNVERHEHRVGPWEGW